MYVYIYMKMQMQKQNQEYRFQSNNQMAILVKKKTEKSMSSTRKNIILGAPLFWAAINPAANNRKIAMIHDFFRFIAYSFII